MRWMGIVLLGSALGVAASASDVVAGGLDQTAAWRALGMLFNAGCVWAALAVLCGWILGTPGRGALAGSVGLACTVAAYYAYGVVFGDRVAVASGGLTGAVLFWLVSAVIAGPVLGAIGSWMRRPGLLGLTSALVVPAGTMVEMLVVRSLDGDTFRIDPWQAWTQVGLVFAAGIGAAAALVRAARAQVSAGHRG